MKKYEKKEYPKWQCFINYNITMLIFLNFCMVELLNFVLKFCLLLCSRKKSMTLKVSPDSNINIYVVF